MIILEWIYHIIAMYRQMTRRLIVYRRLVVYARVNIRISSFILIHAPGAKFLGTNVFTVPWIASVVTDRFTQFHVRHGSQCLCRRENSKSLNLWYENLFELIITNSCLSSSICVYEEANHVRPEASLEESSCKSILWYFQLHFKYFMFTII